MNPTFLVRLSSRHSLRRVFKFQASPHPIPRIRFISSTSSTRYPRKDSQDKDSINTDATEYTKSGTDDAAAEQEEAAFDPSKTDPEQEKDKAGEGNSVNPLEVSPANQEVSKPRGEQEGGPEKGAGEGKRSGHGSPKKDKKV